MIPVKRYPNTTCDLCGAGMYRRPSTLLINAGKFCSRACRNKVHKATGPNPSKGSTGANNPAWKGGVTYFKTHGNYVGVKYVRAPQWARAMARGDGYIMEHRLIMAQRIGRLLSRTEVVHHRDHNPANNHPDNLELWPDNSSHKLAEHGRYAPGAACQLSPTVLVAP